MGIWFCVRVCRTVNKLATSSGYRVNKDVSTALCTALNEVLLLDVDRFVAQNGADVTEEEKKSKMDIVCGHLFKKGEVVYRCRYKTRFQIGRRNSSGEIGRAESTTPASCAHAATRPRTTRATTSFSLSAMAMVQNIFYFFFF